MCPITRMDEVVAAIMQARHELRETLGLDQMFMHLGDRRGPLDGHDRRLRADIHLGFEMDRLRQQALSAMNLALGRAGLPTLKRIGDWS